LVYFGLGYPDGPIFLSLIVALFTTVTSGHRLAGWLLGVGFYAALAIVQAATPYPPGFSVGEAFEGAAWLLVVLVVGEIARVRRERIREAVHARHEAELRRLSDERLRIAQEVHDVVAHNISLINVQAGTALHLMDQQPDQARTALTAIKDASSQALLELRSVLDVLRQRGEEAPRAPNPSMRRLDDLVSGATAAGLDVRTEIDGAPRPLPAAVDLAAYRIVQEALTNVVRHAGAAHVTIRVDYGRDDLTIHVDDDGRRTGGNGEGSGRGIAGMRERAAARDGDLEAGPRPGGGFAVRARLPTSER
jgi:signal transduction histidine kinase